jgi:hypothetical protein
MWRLNSVDMQVACITCYCDGISSAAAASNSSLSFDYFKATTAKTHCKAFTSFNPMEAGINALIAVVIGAVNSLLGFTIRSLTKFERHRSHTEEHAALLLKTAIAQYLNTSISPLIASAEIRWLSVVVGGVIFRNGYPDFTTNWCVPCHCHNVLDSSACSRPQNQTGYFTTHRR